MTASVPIWFDDLAVGQVDVAADGSLSLRYAERWLQTTGAFPLSVTMPLRADPYPSDVISPWLANLLPEEEQLQVLTRSLGLDQADVLAVLSEIGGDTAGAQIWAPVEDVNGRHALGDRSAGQEGCDCDKGQGTNEALNMSQNYTFHGT